VTGTLLKLVGFVAAALLFFLCLSVIHQGFTVFEYASPDVEMRLIPVEEAVGPEVSRVLWSHRPQDVIALAFLLFTAGSGCACILRRQRGEER
jgi:predicted small integral membrane protein